MILEELVHARCGISRNRVSIAVVTDCCEVSGVVQRVPVGLARVLEANDDDIRGAAMKDQAANKFVGSADAGAAKNSPPE